MFSGMVAVVCPAGIVSPAASGWVSSFAAVYTLLHHRYRYRLTSFQPRGLSQGRRKILAKGLASNGATVLDFQSGDGSGSCPVSLLPNASQLLMSAAKNNSKRKRAGEGAGSSKGKGAAAGEEGRGGAGVSQKGVSKQGGPSPTLAVCDAGAFSSGRARREVEGMLSNHPLKDKTSTVKVVGSAWLSECLRLNSLQPMGQHLLETVTPETVSGFAKRNIGGGSGSGSGSGGATTTIAGGGWFFFCQGWWRGRWEELMGGAVLRWIPKMARVSSHILAFDMDGTLIKTKSGKKFGDSVGDWQLLHPNIPAVLKSWHDRGYKIAIISNQLGVASGKVDKRMLKAKVQAVIKALGVPVEALLSCQNDYYRKPRPGCWELLSKSSSNNDSGEGGFEVVKEACMYVGDAAGRPKQGTYKKDFSAGDLKLALNAGIPFQTPEQFFLRSTQPLHKDRSLAVLGFDPSTLRRDCSSPSASNAPDSLETSFAGGSSGRGEGGLELVVLVGPPAGGKSKLCGDRLAGYARVNQDELSSLSRCRQVATARLKEKSSVVIDATNRSRKTRAGWIALARQHGARTRCILFTTPKDTCFHLNAFRGSNPWTPKEARRTVPDVAIHSWFTNMEPVQEDEGFSEVVKVSFATHFSDQQSLPERDFLFMYLLPK